MSRRARLRQHDKRRPTPEPPPIDWAALAEVNQRRQQSQQPTKGQQ